MFIKVFILRRLCQSHQRNLLEMTSGPLPHLLNESWQWGPEIWLPNPEQANIEATVSVKILLYFSLVQLLFWVFILLLAENIPLSVSR